MFDYFLRHGSNVCYLNTCFEHASNVLNTTKLLFILFIARELLARYLRRGSTPSLSHFREPYGTAAPM